MAQVCAYAEVVVDVELPWLDRMHGSSRNAFESARRKMRAEIQQAKADSNDQVIPILLAEGRSVSELRAILGKTTWRKIHHADLSTNLLRALVAMRFRGAASWPDIVALPEHHLRSCRNALDWPTAKFAAQHASAGAFQKFAVLYRDAVKLGITPDPSWSVAKLRRERDRLFSAAKIEKADPTPWAEPFEHRRGEYKFTRLISDRDLVKEGVTMRHCVASYTNDAKAELAFVMRCDGLERATYLFHKSGEVELRGFANAEVSATCHSAAQAAQEALMNTR